MIKNFFSKKNFEGVYGKSIPPIFFSIFAYTFVTIQINAITQNTLAVTNTINLLQAIGMLITGFFSDLFSRRTVHFVIQLMGALLLAALLFDPTNLFIIILLSLLYNPMSLLRATLIDNLPHVSKVQLIALTFIMTNIPDALYYVSLQVSALFSVTSSLWIVIISMMLSAVSFFDRRDISKTKEVRFPLKEFVNRNDKEKFRFTIVAYICAQLVFFLVDNASIKYVNSSLFVSVVSVAYVSGSILSIFYKKTPHMSVLTVNYGLCALIAAVPVICIYVYGFSDINIPTHLVIFSAMTFFGLSFAYDIILSSTHVGFRGLTCGILDSIYTVMTFLNPAVVRYFHESNVNAILVVVLALFLIAMALQKKAETRQAP
jgi:MFS family permease